LRSLCHYCVFLLLLLLLQEVLKEQAPLCAAEGCREQLAQ
jgi:hypothetical protein